MRTDKPEVSPGLNSPYTAREGNTCTLICVVAAANPNTNITWRWIKADGPDVILHNGSTYTIANITRGRSGTYNCLASNTVGTSDAVILVDVHCKLL